MPQEISLNLLRYRFLIPLLGSGQPTTNHADSTKNAAERRRVEVLKSNKAGDSNAIAVNPLYIPSGNIEKNPLYNPASRAINESGVSVKSNTKSKN
ncbi:hypothetical protein [Pedobacter heparinus]|uniref:Uncharacterized protein n=1 Tax=Pedobacter heparinus (strain ATCC 13125 / DSM 2366 / CIP 104194 / JCM 7457 / NBRC 12017 / NCIMB 9290 / NRRL B-14731 / HIM 762-3) TaxID=485917 RepID=C6Y0A2_PEDHD|nr:hypothetical protein [Pedobacter heparinus]ACU04814.1 hypothetical protein Phep_2611 [Pedobacter heparinus DSM 2366]